MQNSTRRIYIKIEKVASSLSLPMCRIWLSETSLILMSLIRREKLYEKLVLEAPAASVKKKVIARQIVLTHAKPVPIPNAETARDMAILRKIVQVQKRPDTRAESAVNSDTLEMLSPPGPEHHLR